MLTAFALAHISSVLGAASSGFVLPFPVIPLLYRLVKPYARCGHQRENVVSARSGRSNRRCWPAHRLSDPPHQSYMSNNDDSFKFHWIVCGFEDELNVNEGNGGGCGGNPGRAAAGRDPRRRDGLAEGM